MNKQIRKKLQSIDVFRKGVRIAAYVGNLHTDVVKLSDSVNSRIYVTVQYTGQVLEVKNQKVPNRLKWPVWVGYVPGSRILHVTGTRDVFPQTSIPEIPEHSHTIYESDNPSWIRREQFLELLPVPIGGMVVRVVGGWYFADGEYHVTNHVTCDMTAYIPTTGARWVNAEIDSSGTVTYNEGASVAARSVLTPEDIPATASTKKLLFSAKTYASQSKIIATKTDTDLFDPRFSGVSTGGGVAGSVDWDDILNKPVVFPPDTDITDSLYVRKFSFGTAPTVDDDASEGYLASDEWLDTSITPPVNYKCLDNSEGAAVWVAEGGTLGNGDYFFKIDGPLAVLSNVYYFLVTRDVTIEKWYIFCESPGTASSTIYDVHLNGTTIFTTQANRPALAFDDADGWAVSGTPEFVDFVEGDILTVHIDQIATGVRGLNGVGFLSGAGGGSSSFNLTVGEIENVSEILTEGMEVVDNGGGSVTIKSNNYILITDEKTQGTDGGTFTSGAWQTRTLNTEVVDTGGDASISSNQITLAAGTYRFKISCPGFKVNGHQAKLYNISDSIDVRLGTSMYSGSSDFTGNRSDIVGEMTIASEKIFEVQHKCASTESTNGFGEKANMGTEIYTVAEFWKVA